MRLEEERKRMEETEKQRELEKKKVFRSNTHVRYLQLLLGIGKIERTIRRRKKKTRIK